jgi:hypothetical protein
MKTYWIILALIFVCAIGLIIFFVIWDMKEKQEVLEFFNTQDEIKQESEH